MKKSIIFFIIFLSLTGCKKDITSLNKDTKRPVAVSAGSLFNYAAKSYANLMTDANVNINVFRFTVSHWAMVTYQDEAQYDFQTRNIPGRWWNTLYANTIQNLSKAMAIVNADAVLSDGVKKNQLAILDIMQVTAYSALVNTFGNVPYSESLNLPNLFPKYDDAKTISLDLLKRLNAGIANLNPKFSGFSANEDLICGGGEASIPKWIKFANSLRMQQGLILADFDSNTAKKAIEDSDAGAISSAAENVVFKYYKGAPNQNPLYVDIVLSSRDDYIAANDLVDMLIKLSDPRLKQFFTPHEKGNYAGGIVGKVNTVSAFSRPNPKVYAEDAPCLLMDYVETEFNRAEAIERGYSAAGTAAEHYNKAIKASILFWGGTEDEANTYLLKPEVAYATAAGTWKEKIGKQKWIALYNRPFNGWTELRRLDFPKITAPVNAKSGFPNRFPYPNLEQQVNGTNYTDAAAAIGGDKVETKLFWDKF